MIPWREVPTSYRSRDTRLGRDVAIKVLPAALSADTDRLARFEREARTVATLNHPNIVVLHSVEDDGGVRFLTMELVEGRSLADSIVAGGLPIEQVVELGLGLADALAAAHERYVVHRDLKPANVMLTRDGRIKVLDFGLAKLAAPNSDSDHDLTQAATAATPLSMHGQVLGTVPYMAPEQVRGGAVDARTDGPSSSSTRPRRPTIRAWPGSWSRTCSTRSAAIRGGRRSCARWGRPPRTSRGSRSDRRSRGNDLRESSLAARVLLRNPRACAAVRTNRHAKAC